MQAARPDIQPETLVRLSTNQTSCEVSGEAVILQLEAGAYYGLNSTGAVVWKAFQAGPATMPTLQNALCEQFEIDSAQCARDLSTLLENMAEAGLVELGPKTQ